MVDEFRFGRTSTIYKTDKAIETINNKVSKMREIVEATWISHGALVSFLNDNVGMRKMSNAFTLFPTLKGCLTVFTHYPHKFLHCDWNIDSTQHIGDQAIDQTVGFSKWISAEEDQGSISQQSHRESFVWLQKQRKNNGGYYASWVDLLNDDLKMKTTSFEQEGSALQLK